MLLIIRQNIKLSQIFFFICRYSCMTAPLRQERLQEVGEPKKRGRGTPKAVVLGAVARCGKVIAGLVPNATGETIKNFINLTYNITFRFHAVDGSDCPKRGRWNTLPCNIIQLLAKNVKF